MTMFKNLSYAMTLFYVVAGFLIVLFGVEPISAQTFTPEHVLKRSERIYTPLSFVKDGKTITLQVEVANTDDLRALGLMYRTKMPDNEGMLFDFEESRPVYMWMQNTFVALDMLFLTEQGQVHHIVKQTTPLSRSLIGSGGAVRFVLEVKAGLVERYQLKKGDQIQHELFTYK
ncbi:MAG: DUF192 domain-containing protein [Cohaesibacter sp.]|nr:DUF192 domain-containing protein [Cohaesibacter sp.]